MACHPLFGLQPLMRQAMANAVGGHLFLSTAFKRFRAAIETLGLKAPAKGNLFERVVATSLGTLGWRVGDLVDTFIPDKTAHPKWLDRVRDNQLSFSRYGQASELGFADDAAWLADPK